MTQPAPPDPTLVEIRDLLREIRDRLTPAPAEAKPPVAIPARSESPAKPRTQRTVIG